MVTVLLALLSVAFGSAAALHDVDQSPGSAVQSLKSESVTSFGSSFSQEPGDFNISAPQLYPEQADHDPRTCLTYLRQVSIWRT